VAFDATVLSGALLKPNGINFELLIRAAEGVPFRGFTTDVAGVEFVRNALEGFGSGEAARRYGAEEIEAFLETFAPLFDDDNVQASPMGRALTGNHALHDMPLGQVLYELTGRDDESLLADLESQPPVTPGARSRANTDWVSRRSYFARNPARATALLASANAAAQPKWSPVARSAI
jgi:hypothetical protein